MKIKKGQVWRRKSNGEEIKVSRLNKQVIFYYPKMGGGAEQKVPREKFLEQYQKE